MGIIVLLLFGKGRFSDMMGDVAKGIKSFRKGLSDEPAEPKDETRTVEHKPEESVQATTAAKKKS